MRSVEGRDHRRAGLSFEVPEWLMLLAWAEFHGLRVVVELDHCVDGEEYEEVVALYPPGSPLRQWTMWRASDAIVVEPMNARAFRLATISEVLQTLVPAAG